MKKFATFMFLTLTAAVFSFARDPKWISDRDSVYPEEKYIARVGRGEDPDVAKAKALGDIASYFKAQVISETKANSKMTNKNGDISKEQSIDQSTMIVSQMDLVAVDYSETYYSKKEKIYYVAAFIDREAAWSAYEPEILKAKNNYESLYDLALGTKEQILRYKYLYKSRDEGYSLISKLYFGFLINPSKKAEYKDTIYEISSDAIFGTLDEQDIPLYLDIQGDQGGIITSAITDIFSNFGFIISTKQSASSNYTLTVSIDDNLLVSDDIYAIYPFIEIRLSNRDKTETFYTWNKRWTKTANFSLKQCQQRAYPKIAEEIKASVSEDYKSHLMGD